jgi:hypothetical protein
LFAETNMLLTDWSRGCLKSMSARRLLIGVE